MSDHRIAIVGSGVMGITTAWYLTRSGYKVTLIEKNQSPALECSYANGGQVSVCNSESWMTLSKIGMVLKSFYKNDSPLKLGGSITLQKIKWFLQFFNNTITGKHSLVTRQLIQLGLESRQLLEELMQIEDINFSYERSGMLSFFTDKKSYIEGIKQSQQFDNTGWERYPISTNEIEKLDPSLNSEDMVGGLYSPNDSQADIYLFCKSLHKILTEKYQVESLFDHEVTAISKVNKQWRITTKTNDLYTKKTFSHLVLATGSDTVSLLKKCESGSSLIKNINIYPVKGYSLTMNIIKDKSNELPKIPVLDDSRKIVSSRLDDRLRVAGIAEWKGWDNNIDQKRIKQLNEWVKLRYPKTQLEVIEQWSCMRPMTPNMLPITKEIDDDLFLCSGAGHLGWTIAMKLAQNTANLMIDKTS